MAIAAAIRRTGGLLLGRSKRSGVFTINVVNIGRAIPTFAVIVLGVIWLGFGNTPVIVALVLLAVPPIFTFTFTGVRQVDAATVDAARGMGMTEAAHPAVGADSVGPSADTQRHPPELGGGVVDRAAGRLGGERRPRAVCDRRVREPGLCAGGRRGDARRRCWYW